MSYIYNPHRHVKIWISKDPDSFLNIENQARLREMRDINKQDEITLIYDKTLLSEKALQELADFCKKYRITAKDVQTEVIPFCKTENELQLVELYQDEIANLKTGGNLAAASDLLRWLSPVYSCGTYTDLDVRVDTRKMGKTVIVDAPLLLNVGSISIERDIESACINIDTIAIVDGQAALPLVKKIQQAIYARCSKQPTNKSSIETFIDYYEEQCSQAFSSDTQRRLNGGTDAQLLKEIGKNSRGKTACQTRREFINNTATNLAFAQMTLNNSNSIENLPISEIIESAAQVFRKSLKQCLDSTNELLQPDYYQELEAVATIEDSEVLLDTMRQRTRKALLKTSVIHTSGPITVLSALFNQLFYTRQDIDTSVAPFSFATYGLDQAFLSQNKLLFHTPSSEVETMFMEGEIGKTNDLSWLEEGQIAIAKREEKMKKTAETLPQRFYEMRAKINNHLHKTQVYLQEETLDSYEEKSTEIRVLQSVLKHFDEQNFNIDQFDQYCSKEVLASLGTSYAKTLIDELTRFGQQARYLGLTEQNEQGDSITLVRAGEINNQDDNIIKNKTDKEQKLTIFGRSPAAKLIKYPGDFEKIDTLKSITSDDKKEAAAEKNPPVFLKDKKKGNTWLANKTQSDRDTSIELILSKPFSIMLAKKGSSNYRALFDKKEGVFSISEVFDKLEYLKSPGEDKYNKKEKKKYYQDKKTGYLNFTENLENFERMLAVCLLFGKADPHEKTWGAVIDKNGRKAAILDHKNSLYKINSSLLYRYMTLCGHRKETIVTKSFIKACKQVINDFDNNKEAIYQACKNGIEASNKLFGSVATTIEEIMPILEHNKKQLENLVHHISCEIAISSNNPEKLKKHAGKFNKEYQGFGLFSTQKNNNRIEKDKGLRSFITKCWDKDSSEESEDEHITDDLTTAYEEGLEAAGLPKSFK